VLVRGADADMMPAPDRVDAWCTQRGRGSATGCVPPEAREDSRPKAANRIAAAGRLTLVLGRTSLSAAGLAVTSVCHLIALNATRAIDSLCWVCSD
jgi:hypothetical protein